MQQPSSFPQTAYRSTLGIALLVAVMSMAGLVLDLYPTDELRDSFLPNDAVNLLVGLPLLLGAVESARRGHLLGWLFWPGALFYMAYNYTVYVVALPTGTAFLGNIAILALSVYTLAAVIPLIDGQEAEKQLRHVLPERASGLVLCILGGMYLMLVVGQSINADSAETPPLITEHALHVVDFLIGGAWLIGGMALFGRTRFGYIIGPGLLYQACGLFVGVILLLILKPLLLDTDFLLEDVLVLLFMGMFVFVPFGVFLRRVRMPHPTYRSVRRHA